MVILPIGTCSVLSQANKKWHEVWRDDYFWFLKIRQDYPELFLPYKNSQFQLIYQNEFMRQILKADFKFGGGVELEHRLELSEYIGVLVRDDEFLVSRVASILTTLTGHKIWDEYAEIILYGVYDGQYIFKIYGTLTEIAYVFDKDCNPCGFRDALKKLISLTEPTYYDGAVNTFRWTHIDEYLNMNAIPPAPHFAFRHRHEQFETFCLLEGDKEYIQETWDTLTYSSAVEGETQVEGIYYGRNFILCPEQNKILLKIEPLLSYQLLEDLTNTLKKL